MPLNRSLCPVLILIPIFLLGISCNNRKSTPEHQLLVSSPAEVQAAAALLITDQLNSNSPRHADSAVLVYLEEIRAIYSGRDYKPVWSDKLDWLPVGDSLFSFIQSSRLFGFFPEDYHFNEISAVRDRFIADSAGKDALRDAWLWSKADMLLTDAFVGILHDIKLGRLPGDSITLRKDTALNPGFYIEQLTALLGGQAITGIVSSLEPKQRGYHDIRKGIPAFLSKATNKEFTKVPLRAKDPAGFKTLLQKRLFEEGYISFDSIPADSSTLASSIKKYQQDKGLAVDGVAGDGTVRTLNTSDREKFIRIAISLDKFKLLPEEMPGKYIWVNVPGYSMDVVEEDTVRFSSKIICGKAKTQTPLLNGAISVLITYPQWVPPPSIVKKEILPAVRKNPDYLARKGFSLVDSKGEVVDPYSVDWSKYTNMPYRVVQGSGDANALGIMKFHFDNKYSVYLHDTNQRYLFANAMRSLSHGCVRVQEWEKLTYYLLRNDSIASGRSSRIDSVKTWLQNKQKRHVALRNKMPVYIRYITCEGKDGGIVFYDDPYGTDQLLRDRYFAGK